MIKLISQFDSEKMRASVATPTCGPCCSCCCCCVVTALTSSIITARNLGRLADPQISSQLSPQVKLSKLQARLFGFFLLPLALCAGFFMLFNSGNFVLVFAIIAIIFGAGLRIFYKKYGLSKKTALLIFFITIVALVGEFFVWLFILLGSGLLN